MGNLKVTLVAVLLAFAFAGCGSKMAPEIGHKPPATTFPTAQITGEVTAADGTTLDLSGISTSLVLTFASDACLACSQEADAYVAHFTSTGGLPKNTRLVTILVGAIMDDVHVWQTTHKVPWVVALDSGDAIFRHYCSTHQTPCTITYNHETKQSRSFYREASIEEVEGETGPWVY